MRYDSSEPDEQDGPARNGSPDRPRDELAEERTDWAMERTLLAKQRTFAAWLRTGLAAVAVGFAAAQLLGDVRPRWVVRLASALLILGGAVTFVIGYRGYRSTFQKLDREGVRGMSPGVIAAVTAAILAAAVLLLLAIILIG